MNQDENQQTNQTTTFSGSAVPPITPDSTSTGNFDTPAADSSSQSTFSSPGVEPSTTSSSTTPSDASNTNNAASDTSTDQALNNFLSDKDSPSFLSDNNSQPASAPKVENTDSTPTPSVPVNTDDLASMKQAALTQLQPLVSHLDQSPEEQFKTTMMMIQATDDHTMLKQAFEAAQKIDDEKERAQALLDVINEINYFTQSEHNAQG